MALEKFDASSLTGTLKYFDSLSVPVEDIRQAKLSCLQNGGFDTFGIRNGTADIAAFTNNQITVIETTDTLTLYRRGYNTELTTGLGKWWTDKPLTIDETRDQLAVLEAWENPLTGEYKINVPKGTKVITGEVAPQFDPKTLEYRKGGGTQYWLNEIPSDWVE